MAHDERVAEQLRADLGPREGLAERRMFGGLAFMLHGNMVCAAGRDSAMFRVARDGMAAALALPGVGRVTMGARQMNGFVEAGPEALADEATRGALLRAALEVAESLPPK